MADCSALLLYLTLSVSAALTVAVVPGFRTEITAKGLDEVRQIGIPILEKELSDVSIPDISGDSDDTHYDLTQITASGLSIPTSALNIVPGTGIQVVASGASMHVNAHWHYRFDWWPHISDSGTCDVSISGVSLTFTVSVGADAQGHPTITAGQCSCSIGHMSIDFHGGASWLYNLFSSEIAGSLKGSLAGQVCSAGKQAINDQANKALESLPVVISIDSNSEIDYRLVAPPSYNTPNFLETSHKGEFYLTKNPTEAPFTPAALPAASSTDRMMYLWLTTYMADSAGYVYQQAGILHYTITPNMVPSGLPFQLNTQSFKDIVPQLYTKYPNRPMILEVNNTAPMTVTSTPAIVKGAVPGTIRVLVQQPDNSTVEAFAINALVHANATIWTHANGSKQFISAKASYLSTDMTLLRTGIGNFSVSKLDNAVNALCAIGVIPFINVYTVPGFEIPMIDGVSLVNPVVQLGQGYAMIATDFSYTPSFYKKNEKESGRYKPIRIN